MDIIPGIHHITGITKSYKDNYEFYKGILGLRFLKETVNFDDNYSYHLYYGDNTGKPGSALTFFVIPEARKGNIGNGQVYMIIFNIPPNSKKYWKSRLEEKGISIEKDDEGYLEFKDPEGLKLGLKEGEAEFEPNNETDIPSEFQLRGFNGVGLYSYEEEYTKALLAEMGFKNKGTKIVSESGNELFISSSGSTSTMGYGSIHHIAFRTQDENHSYEWRNALLQRGLQVSPITERYYFKSVYFGEPGGILFELATDGPGFMRDEDDVEDLGKGLKLPPWLEDRRAEIERNLKG